MNEINAHNIITEAKARAEEIIAEARQERELLLAGIGSLADVKRSIEKYCLKEEDYSYMREVAERYNDVSLYKCTLKDNLKQQEELKEFPGNATVYEQNPTIKAFGLALVCKLATDYFELLFEGLAKNVLVNGIESSKYELIRLQEFVELRMNIATKMKFKDEYMILKMEELEIRYKIALEKQRYNEYKKEEAERKREEIRAQKEYERELKRAQKDEESTQEALRRARQLADVEREGSKERARLESRIASLEAALEDARSRAERAKSMAQQTRCGYVYVISNIGSFGEGVYKIGMTRRLDPMERVTELGDASVPFPFDVHAMIYSEDAPALETALHRAFENRKLNMINGRKEFFSVSLAEIKDQVAASGIDAEFVEEPLAQQWRDSQMFAERCRNKELCEV